MITLTPAYGRDYKSAHAAQFDYDANKDFVDQPSGRYANKSDLKGQPVKIRYNKLRKVVVVR